MVQPQQQQQSTGLSFGTPSATVNPMQQQQPASLSSISFSTPTSQSTGFAAPTVSTSSLSFGLPAAAAQTQPTTGFNFGQQQTSTAVTTSTPALSFGQPAATTSTPALTLSLNPTLSLGQPQTQLSFGAAQAQPSLVSSLSLPLAPALTSSDVIPNVSQPVGLGGIDMNTAQSKAIEGNKNESTKVKETQVPKEIIQTVEDFKTYVKQQKTLSSDIIRTTDRKLKSVTEEIQRLTCGLQEVSNNVDNNKLTIKLLRSDTSKVIQHADMAQRTHETPNGLQFENTMPQLYFSELIHKNESDLLTLKHQVELTETHLQSLSNPQNFSAQDLKRGFRQIHESFIALAGRLQETHTRVEGQKDQYLNLRKFLLRDTTNVFEVEPVSAASSNTSKVQYGPNPFTSAMHMNLPNQSTSKQWPAPPQQHQQPNNSSFFGGFSSGFK